MLRELREEFDRVLFMPNGDSAQHQLHTLLDKHRAAMSWENPACPYACALLSNLPLERIRDTISRLPFEHIHFYEKIHLLSHNVYYEASRVSPEQANNALRDVLPEVFDAMPGARTYEAVMRAYIASRLEPVPRL